MHVSAKTIVTGKKCYPVKTLDRGVQWIVVPLLKSEMNFF